MVKWHAFVDFPVRFGTVPAELGADALLVESLVTQLGLEDKRMLDQLVAAVAVGTAVFERALALLVVAHGGAVVPE